MSKAADAPRYFLKSSSSNPEECFLNREATRLLIVSGQPAVGGISLMMLKFSFLSRCLFHLFYVKMIKNSS
ncbi:MAG: hypothetical protein COV71_03740 [Candidatus Omnitrophica bacterium CG11_big_fil_rev_8_21_14_0_20_41_12]|nr:MAG: hypothetical protein COV71_03740 [Candidatus Omnitrophica bacterium CG11_big_fil_rev_8_21_14_0_20_41_12]